MTCTVCREETDRVDANGACDACNLEALRVACEGRGWTMTTALGTDMIALHRSGNEQTHVEVYHDSINAAYGRFATVVAMLRLLEEHGVGR